jgi:outer membrane protein OmpA-like peptidoglycan-associated protein
MAAKYVGGVVYLRDHAGTGRDPFTPIPAAQQRSALKLLADGLFGVNSFDLKPEILRRMTVDQFDRTRGDADISAVAPDISLSTRLLTVQRSVLDRLMSDAVAVRLTEGETRTAKAGENFRLSELYGTLQDAVWSELKSGRDIASYRRNLQREHLKRMTATLLRPATMGQADARALQRMNARKLLDQIRHAQDRTTLSAEAKAHLLESANTLEEALKAPLVRVGA